MEAVEGLGARLHLTCEHERGLAHGLGAVRAPERRVREDALKLLGAAEALHDREVGVGVGLRVVDIGGHADGAEGAIGGLGDVVGAAALDRSDAVHRRARRGEAQARVDRR